MQARQAAAVAGTQQATGEPISIDYRLQMVSWMAESGSPASFSLLLEKYGGPETNRGKAWKMELMVSGDEIRVALATQFVLRRLDR